MTIRFGVRGVALVCGVVAFAGAASALPPKTIREPVDTPAKSPAARPPPPPPRTTAPPPPPPAPTPIRRRTIVRASAMDIAAGRRVDPTPACAAGQVVSGGYGYMFPGAILSRRPASDGASYVVTGLNNTVLDKSSVFALGICIERPAGYTVVETSRTLAPLARATVDVPCPTGTVLIGGGASAETGVHIAMSAPKVDGSAWSAYLRSDDILANKVAQVSAICASPQAVAGREIVTDGPVQLGPGASKSFTAGCPGNKKALSIGASFSATTTLETFGLTLESRRDAQNRQLFGQFETWTVHTKNTSSGLDNVSLETRLVMICADVE